MFINNTHLHQSTSQRTNSICTKRCDKTSENVLENRKPGFRCPQNVNNAVNRHSTVQSSLIDLRTCTVNNLSSNRKKEEDRCLPKVVTSMNNSPPSNFSHSDETESTPFYLSYDSDQLSKYASKEMSLDKVLQPVPSNCRNSFKRNTSYISESTYNPSNSQAHQVRNASNQEDEKTNKINCTTAMEARKKGNKTPSTCSLKKRRL